MLQLFTQNICDFIYWFGQDWDFCSFNSYLQHITISIEYKSLLKIQRNLVMALEAQRNEEKQCEKVIYHSPRCSYRNRIKIIRGPWVHLKTTMAVEEKQTFSIWTGLKSQSMSMNRKTTILRENKSNLNED